MKLFRSVFCIWRRVKKLTHENTKDQIANSDSPITNFSTTFKANQPIIPPIYKPAFFPNCKNTVRIKGAQSTRVPNERDKALAHIQRIPEARTSTLYWVLQLYNGGYRVFGIVSCRTCAHKEEAFKRTRTRPLSRTARVFIASQAVSLSHGVCTTCF